MREDSSSASGEESSFVDVFLEFSETGVPVSDHQRLVMSGQTPTRTSKRARNDPRLSPAGQDLLDPGSRVEDCGRGREFRRRYRLPYSLLRDLVQMAIEECWFGEQGPDPIPGEEDSWAFRPGPPDVTRAHGIPLSLKVMAAMRMIGRGECADSAAQKSALPPPPSMHSRACSTRRSWCASTTCTSVLHPRARSAPASPRSTQTSGFPVAWAAWTSCTWSGTAVLLAGATSRGGKRVTLPSPLRWDLHPTQTLNPNF